MKNYVYLLISLVMLSCSTSNDEQNKLIGHWSTCERDGTYEEHIFSENKIYLLNKFTTKDEVAVFEYRIEKDSLSGFGLTKNTIRGDTFHLHINIVSAEHIILSNQYVQYNLEKFKEQFQLPQTDDKYLLTGKNISEFNSRLEKQGCQDIRTEEEKELKNLGKVDDNFEDYMEIPFDEKLDELKNN